MGSIGLTALAVIVESENNETRQSIRLKVMSMLVPHWSTTVDLPVGVDCVLEMPDSISIRFSDAAVDLGGEVIDEVYILRTEIGRLRSEMANLRQSLLKQESPGKDVKHTSFLSYRPPGVPDSWLSDLEELGLATRIRNALDTEGIRCIGDLVTKNAVEILRMPNMGKGSLKAIEASLKAKGLRLGVSIETQSDHKGTEIAS